LDGPTEKVKRPLSEAELAARRANAQKSTGPTTQEGKNISRFNRLTHGLRAEIPVLPGECPEAYAHRLATWIEDLGARGDAQRFLVGRAVTASWKMERGDSVEEGLLADSMDAIANGAEEADIEETERLAARLADDPSVIRQLRKTPAGCRWILAQLGILENRLLPFMALLFTQRHLAINLLGKKISDVFRDDPLVTRWVIALLSAVLGNQDVDPEKIPGVLGGGVPEGMSRSEYDQRIKLLAGSLTDKKAANTALKAYIAEAKAELVAHLAVIEELTEYKRARAVRNARVDLTPLGKQILQYQTKHEKSYDSALRRLEALQKPKPQPPEPGRNSRKRKAETDVPGSPVPPVTTQAVSAVTTPVLDGATNLTGEPAAGPGAAEYPDNPASGTTEPGATVAAEDPGNPVSRTTEPGAGATVKTPPPINPVSRTTEPGAAAQTQVIAPTSDRDARRQELSWGPGQDATVREFDELSRQGAEARASPAIVRAPPAEGLVAE
jgi:hypothetical protein